MDESWLPESLHIGLQDLSQTIMEVESLLNTHQTTNTDDEDPLTSEAGENILVENHASILNNTLLIIQELQHITMACIKQGESGLEVPPLDPMLHEWTSECLANLVRIKKFFKPQEEKERSSSFEEVGDDSWTLVENDEEDILDSIEHDGPEENKQNTETSQTQPSTKSDIKHEFATLQDRTTHISEFIPILKLQLDESLSQNISHAPPSQSTTTPSTFQTPLGQTTYSTPAPTTPLISLRRLLYELSDSLKECRRYLTSLSSSRNLPGDIQIAVTSLNTASQISISILSDLLSNNASEWIESMLSGRLSFSEFEKLDQDELREFVEDLVELNGWLVQAVRHRIRSGEDGVVSWEAKEAEMWVQRVGGLNWMLGVRELN